MINPNKDNCCGCGICEKVCAHSAIKMGTDDFGFRYPIVNVERCIDCGLCERICPFHIAGSELQELPKTYAVRHKNPEVVSHSRSGGFFTAITDSIFRSGGIVYGAVLDGQNHVVHKRADSATDRDQMRGSKYSQSNIEDIYLDVKHDLKVGKHVLFSGTPCQVEAVKRFVGKRLGEKLISVDIICHGVGSPEIWHKFINHIEKAEGKKIVHTDFRDKSKYGWNGIHKESFLFENSSKRKYYPYIYYNDFHVRECCRNCPYTCVPRHSDITLGDLWGFEKVVPEWAKGNNGISLILVNNDKGEEWMNGCIDSIELKQIELSKVMQPHLTHPIIFDVSGREKYAEMFRKMSFDILLKKYHKVVKPSVSQILWTKAKMLIKR